MLTITLPFTLDAIQAAIRQPDSWGGHGSHGTADVVFGGATAGPVALRPWSAEQYRAALQTLAALHAQWWGKPPSPSEHPWLGLGRPLTYDARRVEQSREALLRIAGARWGGRFLAPYQMEAWLQALDNPTPLLDIAAILPPTLLHGNYWPGSISHGAVGERAGAGIAMRWGHAGAGVGPAAYDLATFHSASRWWFGRLPLTLVEMRNCYLDALGGLLGRMPDRALFDAGIDAARAWRFAILWLPAIAEHHGLLLARANYLRATVVEPAYGSLRRC